MTTTTAKKEVILVGLDLGTNTTVFQGSKDGKRIDYPRDLVRTLVGYPKAGILPGILPHDADKVFGDDAVNYRLHLSLKWPLKDGHVEDVNSCVDFLNHIRGLIDEDSANELWAVVGCPASTTAEKLKSMRNSVVGVFDRILVVPEPFLATMGLREETRLGDTSYVDPTRHSLIVDIGAGTTDLCLVQGYYPTLDDQVSYPIAGDAVDNALSEHIRRRWPDIKLTRVTVTQLKEKYSFVGDARSEAKVKLYADGRPRVLDIAPLVREACEILVPMILEGIKILLKRCDSDSVEYILKNVIVCGGGSAITGLNDMIEQKMREEGYDDTTCRMPPDYRRLVAMGALKVAETVREDQWQIPM